MADGQHKLSRRSLLGAVCAAPLVRHPGLDPGSTFSLPVPEKRWIPDQVRQDESAPSSAVLKWDRVLARFEKAEAAIAAAAGAPDHLYDPIGARHHAALQRLLRTPAPTLSALARKLELALDERTVEFAGEAAAMRTLKQDAHRLAAPTG